MLLSAVSVLVVAQSSSEIPEGLMNNPVYSGCNSCCSISIPASDYKTLEFAALILDLCVEDH